MRGGCMGMAGGPQPEIREEGVSFIPLPPRHRSPEWPARIPKGGEVMHAWE